MAAERYFLETWVRGNQANLFRDTTSLHPTQEPHPHITYVRPFEIPNGQEDVVKAKIINFCIGKKPIPYVLEGEGRFDEGVDFVPVESPELTEFDSGLEELLQEVVLFDKKLGDKKILHLTLEAQRDPFPRKELAMLRLTCLKNKIIWFSFDFVTQEILSREETLDEKGWGNTLRIYQESL